MYRSLNNKLSDKTDACFQPLNDRTGTAWPRLAITTAIVVVIMATQASAAPVLTNLKLWLDAADVDNDTNTAAAAGAIGTWEDKSGNSFDVTQGTVAKQPSVLLSAINGQPAVRFDGSDDILTRATFDSNINSGDFAIFLVYTHQGVTPTDRILMTGQGDESPSIQLRQEAADFLNIQFGNEGGGAQTEVQDANNGVGNYGLYTISRSGTTISLYDGGVLVPSGGGQIPSVTSTQDLSSATDSLAVGAFLNDIAAWAQVDIAEVFIYQGLSIDDTHATGEYLQDKYNLNYESPVIPEPSTLALAAIGGLACIARRRRS